MDDVAPTPGQAMPPRWRPISAIDRRIIGVLIEKAKTTPDAYPMSVNSLRSGANQKNNRFPLMELEIEDVEESLERLRGMGALTEVQGGGRVPRFRHHLYEWLGAGKVELAVMAELLLRGPNRGRAARPGRPDGPHPRPGRFAANFEFARSQEADCLAHAPRPGPCAEPRFVRAAGDGKTAYRAWGARWGSLVRQPRARTVAGGRGSCGEA